jgi:hypothetical protein
LSSKWGARECQAQYYHQLLHHPKYKDSWAISSANEFGRPAQGLKDGRVKGTDTFNFIQKEDFLEDRWKDMTYGSYRCDYKPNKTKKECTQLTAGGNRINYPDDCGTPTADMTLFKILGNSIISTPNAKCIMMDIKDFYLRALMNQPEFMWLKITDIADKVIEHYNLKFFVTSYGYVYCKIKWGMYSLPQAGIIAQELLEKWLAE